jgi:hypothetical protein
MFRDQLSAPPAQARERFLSLFGCETETPKPTFRSVFGRDTEAATQSTVRRVKVGRLFVPRPRNK